MAKEFNAKEFMSGMVYAPIELGKHTVTIQNAKAVFEVNEAGEDKSYLLIEMKLENDRVVPVRFYGFGIQIATNQIRKQLNEINDIEFNKFTKNLKGVSLEVWVSKRTYTKDGVVKNTLQYDFLEPKEPETATEVVDENPFN